MSDQGKLDILIDVRSRLDELVKSQAEFVRLRQEVNSTGNMLRTGLGIDVARRGLDLLTGTLRASVHQSFQLADSIKDQARNLGVSTDAYQVLGNVLKDAGGDIGLLNMAISQSNRSLAEARTLGSAAAGAYRELGLDAATLERLPIERRFELIGRAVLNSTDKTQAFSSASQILGARNLPTLLGALRDLAEGGYGNLEAAMKAAGRVMEEDTINRLEQAKKNIEKLQQAITIFSGEQIGGGMLAWEALKKGATEDAAGLGRAVGAQFLTGIFMPWRLFTGNNPLTKFLQNNVAPAATSSGGPVDDGSAARKAALTNALAQAEYNLAAATLQRQTVESDPNRSDFQKQRQIVALMEAELALRRQLIAATKAAPLENETQQSRDLKVVRLEQLNTQLNAQLQRLQYGNQFSDQDRTSADNFAQFNQDKGTGVNVGGATRLGAMDWVTGLGNAAQQVSGLIQNSLGAAVSGISDGIYGWITGAMSFGQAMQQLGATIFRTVIETIMQMGVQWLVTQALIKTGMITTHAIGEGLRAQRIAGAVVEGTATTTALAPAAATASISSFGAAAILGIVALIAAMALFGGFASGGYTGDMPTNQIAGVVHGQEGVLNAPAMRRLGVDNLNRLNSGRAMSVANAPVAFGGAGASGSASGGSFSPQFMMFMDRADLARAVQENSRGYVIDLMREFNRKNA